jgi:type I restriction enzyme, S subunit
MNNEWTYELPLDWKWVRLPELIKTYIDNRGRSVPTVEEGFPLIATNCIVNEGLYPKFEKVRFVSDEIYKNWFRAHPLPGDIIIVNKGSPGNTCLVPDPVTFCFAQDMIALRVNPELVDNRYLFSVLRSAHFLNQVRVFMVGTTIPHLKKSDFDKLLIPLPPMDIQKKIGKIYAEISEKIEVNRRLNATLEAMSQALYKHWFVDFGPFQNGNFVESDLGLIPEGWRVVSLESIATFLNGLAMQKFRPTTDQSIPVIKIAELRRGITGASDRARTDIDSKYIVNDGDILFSWSGSLEVIMWTGGVGALNQHLFKVTSTKYPKWLYFLALKHFLPEFQKIAQDKATTMGHIQRHHLSEALLAIPPLDNPEFASVSTKFSSIINSWLNNNLESRNLSQIRDYLLPKLLSGEVTVEAGEEIIESTIPSKEPEEEPKMPTVLYFAYGSNLDIEQQLERTSSAQLKGVATLQDYKVVTNKISKKYPGFGMANLQQSEDESVWGAIYEITEEDMLKLDKNEKGYNRQRIEVVTEQGNNIEVVTYISNLTDNTLVAREPYKETILRGARNQGLPEDYIDLLDRLPSKPDNPK